MDLKDHAFKALSFKKNKNDREIPTKKLSYIDFLVMQNNKI